jgi:hypothetical protein
MSAPALHACFPRTGSVFPTSPVRLQEPVPGASATCHKIGKVADYDSIFSNFDESLNHRNTPPAVSSAVIALVDHNTLLEQLLDFAVNQTDFRGDLADGPEFYAVIRQSVTTAADYVGDAEGIAEFPAAMLAEAERELERIGLRILSDREDARHAAFLDAYENGEVDADGEAIAQWNDWRDPRAFR